MLVNITKRKLYICFVHQNKLFLMCEIFSCFSPHIKGQGSLEVRAYVSKTGYSPSISSPYKIIE